MWLLIVLTTFVSCMRLGSGQFSPSTDVILSSSSINGFSDQTPIEGEFGRTYSLNVSMSSSCVVQYLYNYENMTLATKAIRIHVESRNANETFPMLFVVKQQLGILSWQIPLFADNRYGYATVGRTLCPVQDYFGGASSVALVQHVFVDISTSSNTSVNFDIHVDFEDNFVLEVEQSYTFLATPSEPRYFEVNFPNGTDHLLVTVTSEDTLCSVVSIQDAVCPVFDLERTVQFNGTFQTMSSKAAIATPRYSYPHGFFIVLIVKSTDENCNGKHGQLGALISNRTKNFTVKVIRTITETEYWVATFGIIGFFLLFYLFALVVSIVYCFKRGGEELLLIHAETALYESYVRNVSYGSITPSSSFGASQTTGELVHPLCPTATHSCSSYNEDSDSSLDEADIDLLPDAHSDKEIVRTKTILYVSDLAHKSCKTLSKKSQMYSWNVATIAIFYSLPVVQLVLTYQLVLNSTGNQDICYYNFMCAHPRGYFSDFNHVYSNIGFILLGFLFLSLVYRRDLLHKKLLEVTRNNEVVNIEKHYGIPHHFGLFYAMAIALMMEGLMSACYHVCPNYTNFQFDTAFMYMIAGLSMLKIYQTRHPDINADAYTSSLAFALVILAALIGVLSPSLIFHVTFATVHMLSCLALSAQIYYMGQWKLNLGIFKRLYLQMRNDILSGDCFCRPLYTDRMILLALGNIVNWSLSIYGCMTQPKDFSSYLLSIFMVNLVLYLTFYIIMKLRHGEKIMFLPKLYIVLSWITWGISLYFFVSKKSSTWELTPAQSRAQNTPCIVLNFYDDHDIWHFLSATSMFFSYMILLTLDDDLILTPRSKIPVF